MLTFTMWDIFKEIGKMLLANWPFLVVYVLILGAAVVARPFVEEWTRKKIRLRADQWVSDQDFLQWLRGMDPAEFEKYISDLFFKLGYQADQVGGESDGGIDIVLIKNGVRYYVQCKRYRGASVSVGEVREFYGALAHLGAKGKAYFVTTTKFSLEAEKFAANKPIELIDGFKLIEYITLAEKAKKDEV